MDPIVSVVALSKLIGLGMKGWTALDDRDLDKDDVEALRTLLDTGTSISSMRRPAPPSAAAVHLALIARAFGRAVGRHQEIHGKMLLSGGLKRWLSREDREREREIKLRVGHARLQVQKLGDAPRSEAAYLDQLTGSPLGTPYYRALWQAFSDPRLTIAELDEEPPLVMSNTARSEFERYFLLAYQEGVASPAGQGLREYLERLGGYRTKIVRDLLIADVATWGGRHVFGNVTREGWNESEAIPFLPLDALYVEPHGITVARDGSTSNPEPLLTLIDQLVHPDAPEKVIVVVADFGSGKSLSARMAARRWADHYLHDSDLSLDLTMPVYVRCSEDFPNDKVDLPSTLRMAWQRQARAFKYSISEDDDSLTWPSPEQRLVCLLDGLDEVSMGEPQTKTLFQKLRTKTRHKQRFVVFSRPGAVPAPRDLGDDVITVKVQPFDEAQIASWLAAWNALRPDRLQVTPEALVAQTLQDLASTPILLFMIAFTWEETRSGAPPSRAEIYERFFQQVAAGKAEADRDEHGPITEASTALRMALQGAGILDARATLPDAMLWLMGRVAWEVHRLEQRRPAEVLDQRLLDNLLHEGDFELPASSASLTRIGLVLALQADLHSANHIILFGHQSFREFLVGRYWAGHLHRLVRGGQRDWDSRKEALLGGRLMGEEDKSFDFLMQIINAEAPSSPSTSSLTWNDHDREALVRWAQEIFNDERQVFAPNTKRKSQPESLLRHDQSAALREAALAIGSLTRKSPGLRQSHPLTLRSMLAWFWLESVPPRILATRGQLANAVLKGADLSFADFSGADLSHADLSEAILEHANLHQANLKGADLSGTYLSHADLSECDLQSVDFAGTQLYSANLRSSNLIGATLAGAYFGNANLSGIDLTQSRLNSAYFSDANLSGTNLSGTNLSHADFSSADLSHANLSHAELRDANLRHADLSDADLSYANLSGADLSHADLSRANLDNVTFSREESHGGLVSEIVVRFDDNTVWPDGFDPPVEGSP